MAITSILNNTSAQAAAVSIHHAMDRIKTSSIRLSSGERITQASDDAAGLSIGTGLKTDRSTLEAALGTATQASAILSIADGGMANISGILGRLKSLASQANNGGMSATELGYIQLEMNDLVLQIGTVVTTTKFNANVLLTGTFTAEAFQVGLATTDTIPVSFPALDTTTLGINAMSVTTAGGVTAANNALDAAITTVLSARAQLGADQSRFNFAAANIETSITNTGAAASIYLDADFATISTEFANEQTQLQAGIATLANVNSLPANLLKLIS